MRLAKLYELEITARLKPKQVCEMGGVDPSTHSYILNFFKKPIEQRRVATDRIIQSILLALNSSGRFGKTVTLDDVDEFVAMQELKLERERNKRERNSNSEVSHDI